MTTLFEASLDVARELMAVREGVSDGAGSVTTLVDSTLNLQNEDQYKNGILWILTGDLANSLLRPTAYAQSTGTLTFATQASAPGTGAAYALAPHDIELHEIKSALNVAARRYDIPKIDESLTTVANQQSYTLPAGVSQVFKIEVNLSDTAPYQWQVNNQWREIGGKIYFDNRAEYATAGYTIRLYYVGKQDYLDAWTDSLNHLVHPDVIKWRAVLHIAEQKIQQDPNSKKWVNLLRQAQFDLDRALGAHPLPDIPAIQRYSGFGAWMDIDRAGEI